MRELREHLVAMVIRQLRSVASFVLPGLKVHDLGAANGADDPQNFKTARLGKER